MTFAAGENLLVADLSGFDTRLTALEAGPDSTRIGCALRRVANQSVATGTSQFMNWDTEDQDTHGFITVTSGTVTIPSGQAGVYAFAFRALGSLTVATRTFAEVNVTSSLAGATAEYRVVIPVAEDRASPGGVSRLAVGDTLVCNVFHSEAGNVNFTGNFQCWRVSA